jgi:hypothetical protein
MYYASEVAPGDPIPRPLALPHGVNQPKREPSADLRQAAPGLFELYVALTDQGFTERQALVALGQVIAANGGGKQ